MPLFVNMYYQRSLFRTISIGSTIFNGDYHGFSPTWYADVGQTLCFTMLIKILAPHASKGALALIKLLKRIRDRGYKKHLDAQDQNDKDLVNTKLLTQDDLNELYTGSQISSHYVYA